MKLWQSQSHNRLLPGYNRAGATNAFIGVAQAYLDSSPMVVLSGQANSRLLNYEIQTGRNILFQV